MRKPECTDDDSDGARLRRLENAGIETVMFMHSVIDGLGFSGRVRAHSSLAYLPVHDHKRLPGRFFARLTGADGSIATNR